MHCWLIDLEFSISSDLLLVTGSISCVYVIMCDCGGRFNFKSYRYKDRSIDVSS